MTPTNSLNASDDRRCCVIADDARLIRKQLGQWMEEQGFAVVYAACGATALRAVRQNAPDIVITDIDMPHLSGLNLIHALRSDPDPKIANVPVIVSSSLRDSSIDRILSRFGSSVFLAKPVKKKRFQDCVDKMLSGDGSVRTDKRQRALETVSKRFQEIASQIGQRCRTMKCESSAMWPGGL